MQIIRKTNLFNICKTVKDSTTPTVQPTPTINILQTLDSQQIALQTDIPTKTFFSTPQFVTFSNYSECITGNHLAVNNKLYPSAFICLDVPKLCEAENQESFFNDCLISHYENKLAFLRDYFLNDDTGTGKNIDKDFHPLDYLLKCIKEYDSSAIITNISDIVEQNYNGVYSDMMLTITAPEDSYTYTLSYNSVNTGIDYSNYVYKDILYGWYDYNHNSYNYNGPSSFKNNKPIFDHITNNNSSNIYYTTSYYNNINISNNTATNATIPSTLDFNIIIPLFNIYVEDVFSNTNNATSVNSEALHFDLSKADASHFIPYGIWYSGTDKVSLKRNTKSETSDIVQPSWSLVLSSQFSAFPYTNNYSTNYINNSNNKQLDKTSSNIEYHNMFAQVLCEQNNLIDLLYKQNKDIADLRQELTNLKNRL